MQERRQGHQSYYECFYTIRHCFSRFTTYSNTSLLTGFNSPKETAVGTWHHALITNVLAVGLVTATATHRMKIHILPVVSSSPKWPILCWVGR